MDRGHSKNQKILYNLVYLILVFTLVYQFGLGIGLKLSLLVQAIYVITIASMVKFFVLNPLILYFFLSMILLAAIIANQYIVSFIGPLLEGIVLLLQNILYNFLGRENILDKHIFFYWIILIVFISMLNLYLLSGKKTIYLLLPIYIASFLYYWYNFYDQSYILISIFFITFFILMGSYQFGLVGIDKSYLPWMGVVSKYSILIVLLAFLLPKKYNYISLPWLQERVYRAFPFVENLRTYDIYTREIGEASLFNFSMTGEEDSSPHLGGPVNLSDKKIMTLYSSEGHYLRGNVQHTYTGNRWQTIKDPISYARPRIKFGDYSKEDVNKYYKSLPITIQNHDFATTTLFSPYRPYQLDFNISSDIIINRDDILVFPTGVYDGESYTIWIKQPLPYGVLLANGADFTKDYIDDIDIYLQLPEDIISHRTRNLTKEVVGNLVDDYKKALAIETYLRENFSYSLYPDPVPKNHEFIDYFLFEGKEGYCTYYATAMSIMLRLEGIPARYVEGYLAKDLVDKNIYCLC